MDSRQARMAENEKMARRMNEAIERETHDELNTAHQFLCECAKSTCASTLNIRPSEYMRVRSRPRWFVVIPGHEQPEVERTVETHNAYVVVEKCGEAGAVAEGD